MSHRRPPSPALQVPAYAAAYSSKSIMHELLVRPVADGRQLECFPKKYVEDTPLGSRPGGSGAPHWLPIPQAVREPPCPARSAAPSPFCVSIALSKARLAGRNFFCSALRQLHRRSVMASSIKIWVPCSCPALASACTIELHRPRDQDGNVRMRSWHVQPADGSAAVAG